MFTLHVADVFIFCDHVYAIVFDFVMDRKLEQRSNVKFCIELEKPALETISMHQEAYGDEVTCCTECFNVIGELQKKGNLIERR